MRTHTQRDRNRDTGMALALLLLIAYLASKRDGDVVAAVLALVISMTVPVVLQPLAVLWFGLSRVLGAVMSRVVMAVVFFVVVTPVGVVRRLLGRDSLRLREFGKGRSSVLTVRNHRVSEADLVNPY